LVKPAEADRFPEVADYVHRSWDRNQRQLADALSELGARRQLRLEAPDVAAEQFTWFVLAGPLNPLTLRAGTTSYDDRDLGVIATEAVTTFLSRFGVH
jgi:hypothetical protein